MDPALFNLLRRIGAELGGLLAPSREPEEIELVIRFKDGAARKVSCDLTGDGEDVPPGKPAELARRTKRQLVDEALDEAVRPLRRREIARKSGVNDDSNLAAILRDKVSGDRSAVRLPGDYYWPAGKEIPEGYDD